MLKKAICAAALMACAMSAHAEVKFFDFSYQYFFDPEYGRDVDYLFKGQFSAEDTNTDGIYGVSELRSFSFNSEDYLPCSQESGEVSTCSISQFSYQPGAMLNFSVDKKSVSDSTINYFSADTGGSIGLTSWPAEGGHAPYYYVYAWSNQTQFSISAVPEPQTYMMFGAGLLALLGVARRRSKALGKAGR